MLPQLFESEISLDAREGGVYAERLQKGFMNGKLFDKSTNCFSGGLVNAVLGLSECRC